MGLGSVTDDSSSLGAKCGGPIGTSMAAGVKSRLYASNSGRAMVAIPLTTRLELPLGSVEV